MSRAARQALRGQSVWHHWKLWNAGLAERCSVIFTMLVDDNAVQSVVRDILRAQPARGTIIVECR